MNEIQEFDSCLTEDNYLTNMEGILKYGESKTDRTGVGTIGLVGLTINGVLSESRIPLLTTKRVFWKGVAEELLWFIRGDTDSTILEEKGINIWKGNTTREFIDNRGLNYPEGEIGPGYGFQWRNWGGDYDEWLRNKNRTGIDQLENLIEGLREDPTSRRHILSSWNVSQIEDMVLPPCHMICQFISNGTDIDCVIFQRSCDYFLGVPFNIASYSLLTHLIGHYTGLNPRLLRWVGGDVHIYNNHINQCREQLTRTIKRCPTLELVNMPDSIEKVTMDNLVIHGYDPAPAIKADMAV